MFSRYRQLSLGWKILIFMMIGVVAGIVAGERAEVVQPLGDLFIRLLMMAVIPHCLLQFVGRDHQLG